MRKHLLLSSIFVALFMASDMSFCTAEPINAGIVYEFYIDVENQIVETKKPFENLPEIKYSAVDTALYKDFRPLNMLSSSNLYFKKNNRIAVKKEEIPKEYNISLKGEKIAAAAKIPLNVEEYLERALIFKNSEKYTKALSEVNCAIKFDPTNTDAHYIKGDILRILGKLNESVAEYVFVIRLDPSYTNAYFNIAKIFENTGNDKTALDFYRYAYVTSPSDYEIMSLILNLERKNSKES